MENYIFYLAILIMILYPFVEGVREYYFYGVNKAAGYSQRSKDSDRKIMNVLTWFMTHVILVLQLGNQDLVLMGLIAIALAFWRWIVLDGVLNLKRELGFWYAERSGRSFTDRLLNPLSIPARAAWKLTPFFLALTLIYLITN